MDFSFIDKYTEDRPPEAGKAMESEIDDLVNIARYIPCIHWEYDDVNVPSNGDQLGFITQALSKVPGLASAVSTDDRGIENFDARFVAAASLSLVAALARKVLGIQLSQDYAEDVNNDLGNELGGSGQGQYDPYDPYRAGAEGAAEQNTVAEQDEENTAPAGDIAGAERRAGEQPAPAAVNVNE